MAQQSALAQTTAAIFIGDLPGVYAYAVILHDGEVDVQGFPNQESLRRALAEAFTYKGKWKWPQSWDRVYVFGPDQPIRCYMEIEYDGSDEGVA